MSLARSAPPLATAKMPDWMNGTASAKVTYESTGKPGMFVAASRPPALMASRISGKITEGTTCAGWRRVRMTERRASSDTWVQVAKLTRAPRPAPARRPARPRSSSSSPEPSSVRPVLARNTSSSVGACSWRWATSMLSASRALTTSTSEASPPFRRTATLSCSWWGHSPPPKRSQHTGHVAGAGRVGRHGLHAGVADLGLERLRACPRPRACRRR